MSRSAGVAELRVGAKLGDEALAMTLRQGAGASAIRFFLVGWRERNVSASLVINGFDGRVNLADALALAQKQQRHIARAADS